MAIITHFIMVKFFFCYCCWSCTIYHRITKTIHMYDRLTNEVVFRFLAKRHGLFLVTQIKTFLFLTHDSYAPLNHAAQFITLFICPQTMLNYLYYDSIAPDPLYGFTVPFNCSLTSRHRMVHNIFQTIIHS